VTARRLLSASAIAVLLAGTGAPSGQPAQGSFTRLRAHALSPFAAVVTWTDTTPGRAAVSYGLEHESEAVWASTAKVAAEHTIRIDGLAPGSTYELRPHVRLVRGGAASGPTLTVETPRVRGPVTTAVGRDGSILLDGVPFFPIMQWLQCPSSFATNVALGVDVFLGKGCSDNPDATEVAQLASLGAFSVLPFDAAVQDKPGLFGWHFDDEPDGNGEPPTAVAQQFRRNRTEDPRHVNFLTVESNFYSRMSPPAISGGDRSVYRGYASTTDVLGFDLYPIYGWCRPDWISWVGAAQRQLVDDYAGGRPTYQWIEATATSGRFCKGPGPTATEVRAEVWMAVVNGAKAIGYFTHSWTPDYSQFRVTRSVQAEMQRTDGQLRELTPVLLGRETRVRVAGTAAVEATARSYGGATYVLAVNTSRSPQRATFTVAAPAARSAGVIDEGRSVRISHGSLSDAFAPLQVHLYELAPRGF